jgi:signal transduction histidine kinase
MRFKEYLKDKIIYISLLVFAVITIEILLIPYDMQIFIKIYVAVAIIVAFLIGFLVEYYSKKNYYDTVKSRIKELQEEYLIMEVLPKADFAEANILEDVIRDIGKSMLENVNKYKYLQEDYKDFIELWIHEIKIPIATSKMIVENNKNEITESINEELDKIDNYTEQALFYARSNTVEKDYIVRKIQLKEIVNASILKNKAQLIQNKISIYTKDLDETVYTDSKWCIFIINQIIQNSIKYSKNADRQIEIYGERKKENIILHIKDNGIGIKESEITRVFEKGFTGENGRITDKKSTGIGLYLCKKLCDKLCIGLELNSKKDEGTEVKLIFPKNSFINMKQQLT